MASIGEQSVYIRRGRVPAAGGRAELIPPLPGQDATRYRQIGLRSAESRIETVAFSTTVAAAAAAVTAYKGLQGTSVTVVDELGLTHAGVRVMDVSGPEGPEIRLRRCLVAGAARVMVEAVWTVRTE